MQDTTKLMDDAAALRPTIFCSVPRLYNRIYTRWSHWTLLLNAIFFIALLSLNDDWAENFICSIINSVKTSGALRERLFNAAYNAKKQALLNGRE